MNRDDSDGISSSNDGEHDHFGSECSDDEALAAVGELMCAVKKNIIVYLFP